MILSGQLSLLPYNLIPLNRILVINLEGLFLKRDKDRDSGNPEEPRKDVRERRRRDFYYSSTSV